MSALAFQASVTSDGVFQPTAQLHALIHLIDGTPLEFVVVTRTPNRSRTLPHPDVSVPHLQLNTSNSFAALALEDDDEDEAEFSPIASELDGGSDDEPEAQIPHDEVRRTYLYCVLRLLILF
jgi:hypothetical protein